MSNKNLNLEHIILISLKKLSQTDKKASFGKLVVKAFKLFPQQIALSDFPQYPDSLKLDRSIRTLRNENLISGSPTTYFRLTKNGDLLANKLINKFKGIKNIKTDKSTSRSPTLKILDKISKSVHYKNFIADRRNFSYEEMRIRELLGFTLETPLKKVISELDYLLNASAKNSNRSVLTFLRLYRKHLKSKTN